LKRDHSHVAAEHCALRACAPVTFAGLALLYLQLKRQSWLSRILIYIGAVAILIVFAVL